MADRQGGLDQLFNPGYRLIVLDPHSKPSHIGGDCGRDIQITLVGGPAKRGAQIGQLDRDPVVGLSLAGAVPAPATAAIRTGRIRPSSDPPPFPVPVVSGVP